MSRPKTIKIDEVEYVRADSVQTLADPMDGLRYCIARCRDAGVHAGFVKEQVGREVVLLNSRRLWRWHGKTLSGLATEGTTKLSACKYSDEIPEIKLLEVCELISCTEAGVRHIREEVGPWKNE